MPFRDLFLIVGPPGTGKTTTLMSYLEKEVEHLGPAAVADVTFTRDATRETLDRLGRVLGVDRDQVPWVRTIHSMAYRLLGLTRKQTMMAKNWKEFSSRYGYEFTDSSQPEDDTYEPPRATDDDDLRAAHDWGRNRCMSPEETERAWPNDLDRNRFYEYVVRYRAYKAEADVFDFTDMLEQSLTSWVRPPVTIAAIDEAQDLSPLQQRVVERWFAGAERVYVAGDDDQAIFQWAGASPQWMIDLSKTYETAVLDRSHRVPASVHALASRIIRRNRHRIQKEYQPKDDAGSLSIGKLERSEIPRVVAGQRSFVLARNKMFLQEVAQSLLQAYVPYVLERGQGPNPLGHPKLVRAVATASALGRGESVTGVDLTGLLEFVPSEGAVRRGYKTRVRERKDAILAASEIRENMAPVLNAIREHGPASVLSRRPLAERDYLQRLLDRHGGKLPRPSVRLTTIHGSKGREADTVVILPDMAKASYREWQTSAGTEPENRVAYVAVTRARRQLVVCAQETPRAYDYPRMRS